LQPSPGRRDGVFFVRFSLRVAQARKPGDVRHVELAVGVVRQGKWRPVYGRASPSRRPSRRSAPRGSRFVHGRRRVGHGPPARFVERPPCPSSRKPGGRMRSSGGVSRPKCTAACGPCRPGSRRLAGSPTRSSRSTIFRHECIPPPADFPLGGPNFSPCSRAILPGLPERLGDLLLVARGVLRPVARPAWPSRCGRRRRGRAPISRRRRGDVTGPLRTCLQKTSCAPRPSSIAAPAAGPAPHRRHDRADRQPPARAPCRPTAFRSSSVESTSPRAGRNRNRSTPSEADAVPPRPSPSGRAMVSRSMNGSAPGDPLPTTPRPRPRCAVSDSC